MSTHVPALVIASLALGACGSSTGEIPAAAGTLFSDSPAGSAPSGGPFETVGGVPTVVVGRPGEVPGSGGGVDGTPPIAPGTSLPGPAAMPFAVPEPGADTLVARLGHEGLRELAARLVAARHIDAYLAVDDAVLALLEGRFDGADGELPDGPIDAPTRLDCPGGGQLDATRERSARGVTFDLAFAGCTFGDTTLSGALLRAVAIDGFRLGTDETLELDFGDLLLDAGAAGTTRLSGHTRRDVTRRASEGCRGEDVDTFLAHDIVSADVRRDGATEHVSNARYVLVRTLVRTSASASPLDCHDVATSVFEGSASASEGRLGTSSVTLATHGRLARDSRESAAEDTASAWLRVIADDGSRLALELLSDRDGTARTDIASGASIVSFETAYRFEP